MEKEANLPQDNTMKAGEAITLAENLKRLMKKRHLTISQAAAGIKMNKSTLHGYCNGVIPRNVLTLRRMAEFFEISLPELLYGSQSNPQNILQAFLLEGVYELTIRRTAELPSKHF
jgi:transcriptional regulator with XRE-family HTH domain